ncbi:hypothetical protein [Cognatishimia sp.]|uniref:hypothetical protein n=1 Tax=Cognatishimia sp. TaxID=2211648 RepID=UPI003513956D|nr:hypothetical protein [Cognatishimia sp.]
MPTNIDTILGTQQVPTTTNYNIPYLDDPDEEVDVTQGRTAQKTLHLQAEAIDSTIKTVEDSIGTSIDPINTKADNNETAIQGLDTRLTAAEGSVSTNTSAIVTANQNIANLQVEKEDKFTKSTTATIARDEEKRITTYQENGYTYQNPTFDVNGDLETFEEVVNGTTYQTTLTRGVDSEVTDIVTITIQ